MSPLRQSARLRPYYAPKTRSAMLRQQIASMRDDDYSSAAGRRSKSSSTKPGKGEIRKSPTAAGSKKRKSGSKGSEPAKAGTKAKAEGGKRHQSSDRDTKTRKNETLKASKAVASAPRDGGATAPACDDERLGRIRTRCFTLLHRLSRAITFAEVWTADMKRSQRRGLDASVFPVVEMAKAEDAIPETKIQIRLLLKEYDQYLTDTAVALQPQSMEEEGTSRRSNRKDKSPSSKQVSTRPSSPKNGRRNTVSEASGMPEPQELLKQAIWEYKALGRRRKSASICAKQEWFDYWCNTRKTIIRRINSVCQTAYTWDTCWVYIFDLEAALRESAAINSQAAIPDGNLLPSDGESDDMDYEVNDAEEQLVKDDLAELNQFIGKDGGDSSSEDDSAEIVHGKRSRAPVDYTKLNAEIFGDVEAYEGELEDALLKADFKIPNSDKSSSGGENKDVPEEKALVNGKKSRRGSS